jgi:hypothetical protein
VSPSWTAYSKITCSFVSRASGTRSSELLRGYSNFF